MSVKAIVKKYNYNVGGVAVRTREEARALQRTMRAGGELPSETKIVQRVLMERYIR